MDYNRKIFLLCILVIEIWIKAQADAKSINLTPRSSKQYKSLRPITTNSYKIANNNFPYTKSYSTKPQRTLDNFNTPPDLKPQRFSAGASDSPLFTSYAPPPSGLVSHKNIQLPLKNSIKLPLLLPQSTISKDYALHPGFALSPNSRAEHEFTEPPTTAVLQTQLYKTLEAANLLASKFLETEGKSTPNLTSGQDQGNSANYLLIKTQKLPFIPTAKHSNQEGPISSPIEKLSSINRDFPKDYTINQFIFVIKPAKINFFL